MTDRYVYMPSLMSRDPLHPPPLPPPPQVPLDDLSGLTVHICQVPAGEYLLETSNEIPAGSIPRSLDVILRYDIVEQARSGDTVIFTGTVVALPDILALASTGERAEVRRDSSQSKNAASGQEGVKGLRALGVRDLCYRLAFIANSVQISDGRTDTDIRNRREDGEEEHQHTPEEVDEVRKMRNTPDFFNKIVDSIAPTIFGHQDIKRAILLMLTDLIID